MNKTTKFVLLAAFVFITIISLLVYYGLKQLKTNSPTKLTLKIESAKFDNQNINDYVLPKINLGELYSNNEGFLIVENNQAKSKDISYLVKDKNFYDQFQFANTLIGKSFDEAMKELNPQVNSIDLSYPTSSNNSRPKVYYFPWKNSKSNSVTLVFNQYNRLAAYEINHRSLTPNIDTMDETSVDILIDQFSNLKTEIKKNIGEPRIRIYDRVYPELKPIEYYPDSEILIVGESISIVSNDLSEDFLRFIANKQRPSLGKFVRYED